MSCTEARGSARRLRLDRRRQRGAVLLEAVLIVSVLLLSLIGTIYVARIYLTSLRAVAVSRAAAIGYSTRACRGDTSSWFTEREAALLAKTQSDESSSSPSPQVGDDAARRALSQATQSGSFASPRVVSTIARGEVFGPMTNASGLGGIFYTKVEANDHVLCGEIEHRRGVLGILGFARDFFKF